MPKPTPVVANLPMEVWALVFGNLDIQQQTRVQLVCKSFCDAIDVPNIPRLARKMFEELRNSETWDEYDGRYGRFAEADVRNTHVHLSYDRTFCFDLEGNLVGYGSYFIPYYLKNKAGLLEASSAATNFYEIEPSLAFPHVNINFIWGGRNPDKEPQVRSSTNTTLNPLQSRFFAELQKQLAVEGHRFFFGVRKIAQDKNLKCPSFVTRSYLPEDWEQVAKNPALYTNKEIWEIGEEEYIKFQDAKKSKPQKKKTVKKAAVQPTISTTSHVAPVKQPQASAVNLENESPQITTQPKPALSAELPAQDDLTAQAQTPPQNNTYSTVGSADRLREKHKARQQASAQQKTAAPRSSHTRRVAVQKQPGCLRKLFDRLKKIFCCCFK